MSTKIRLRELNNPIRGNDGFDIIDLANRQLRDHLGNTVLDWTNGMPAPVLSYGYFYNLAVAATVAIGAPFPFDTTGPSSVGFTHTASPIPAVSAPITIVNSGIYSVDFTVTVAEARQVALYKNGVVDLSTIFGQATGTCVTAGSCIISATAGDVLTLRNHLSVAALTLVTPSGGTANNTTNTLRILRVA